MLARGRPFMQADGGDIELIGNSAGAKLTGMCAGCLSDMTLYLGVETGALRQEIPEFETLRVI